MEMERIQPKGNYIVGKFEEILAPEGHIESRSPADLEDKIADFPYSSKIVQRTVEAASQAFSEWKLLPLHKRMGFFDSLYNQLRKGAYSLAQIISRETGKPYWESKTEVKAMSDKIKITRDQSMPLIATKPSEEATERYSFKPRGVLAVLGPFNMPGHLPWGHIIPALMTGNTVIFKPSELTPAVGQKLAEIIHEAGFPPGVFNLIQGPKEVGSSLIAHPALNGILFTGSYQTGQRIKEAIRQHVGKILALEMGGKNAAIVLDDAHIDKALYEVLIGASITTGQRCSSTSRLIIDKRIADEFLTRLIELAKRMVIGYPFDDGVFMGPLISGSAREKFCDFQKKAFQEGAEILLEGGVLEQDRKGYYVSPSIHLVKNLNPENIYQNEEIFGPDLAVYLVDNLREAIDIQNQSSYGLALSLFSRSQEAFEKVLQECCVGVIHWNKATTGASSRLPFGGQKKSGNDHPSALFAPFYCTYPVAIKIDHSPLNSETLPPGIRR
ncbi:MAG: aldehyde dehydrogenase family protein [Candidatus Tectomicrobia bacterium]|uniref:Aldehyde dehydrogenase family protein n=1 Tax=Tectimicrobiota bacterium TaxID=2528274 RepID=A0A933LQI9_UNCTE|nr:aldehyde dehydrogenase family protein [Candidatus Tectomicrobia bacterium]